MWGPKEVEGRRQQRLGQLSADGRVYPVSAAALGFARWYYQEQVGLSRERAVAKWRSGAEKEKERMSAAGSEAGVVPELEAEEEVEPAELVAVVGSLVVAAAAAAAAADHSR